MTWLFKWLIKSVAKRSRSKMKWLNISVTFCLGLFHPKCSNISPLRAASQTFSLKPCLWVWRNADSRRLQNLTAIATQTHNLSTRILPCIQRICRQPRTTWAAVQALFLQAVPILKAYLCKHLNWPLVRNRMTDQAGYKRAENLRTTAS